MADQGTSVTLIFYRVGNDWYKEPFLNLVAAAAQMSSYTHVELAIGEVAGQGGMMANVARIYNDAIGVEICERTGRNPQVSSLPCSQLLPLYSSPVSPSNKPVCVLTIFAHSTPTSRSAAPKLRKVACSPLRASRWASPLAI